MREKRRKRADGSDISKKEDAKGAMEPPPPTLEKELERELEEELEGLWGLRDGPQFSYSGLRYIHPVRSYSISHSLGNISSKQEKGKTEKKVQPNFFQDWGFTNLFSSKSLRSMFSNASKFGSGGGGCEEVEGGWQRHIRRLI